jgi:hypothetical protein
MCASPDPASGPGGVSPPAGCYAVDIEHSSVRFRVKAFV